VIDHSGQTIHHIFFNGDLYIVDQTQRFQFHKIMNSALLTRLGRLVISRGNLSSRPNLAPAFQKRVLHTDLFRVKAEKADIGVSDTTEELMVRQTRATKGKEAAPGGAPGTPQTEGKGFKRKQVCFIVSTPLESRDWIIPSQWRCSSSFCCTPE